MPRQYSVYMTYTLYWFSRSRLFKNDVKRTEKNARSFFFYIFTPLIQYSILNNIIPIKGTGVDA